MYPTTGCRPGLAPLRNLAQNNGDVYWPRIICPLSGVKRTPRSAPMSANDPKRALLRTALVLGLFLSLSHKVRECRSATGAQQKCRCSEVASFFLLSISQTLAQSGHPDPLSGGKADIRCMSSYDFCRCVPIGGTWRTMKMVRCHSLP
jgi:hypothetical protein